MSKLTRVRKNSVVKPVGALPTEKTQILPKVEEYKSELEEYKLAIQVQQGYYDLVFKSITAFFAITALSLGFIFRESLSNDLKLIFSWFNLIMSLFFVIGFTGFYFISKRVSRRMEQLAAILDFELRQHNALNYGIFLTLLSGIGVFIFWIATLVFRFWTK